MTCESRPGWGPINNACPTALAAYCSKRETESRPRRVGLTGSNQCVTMGHMKTITIRELHQATGRWVRRASEGEILVTERGRLIAKIVAATPLPCKPFFANPKFTRAFLAQRKHLRGGTDSTRTISEERERDVF